ILNYRLYADCYCYRCCRLLLILLFVGFVHGDFKLIILLSNNVEYCCFLIESVVLYGGYILPVFVQFDGTYVVAVDGTQ
ncbi:hypothetical protein DERF_009901, partial [Dermatophagoides farinae]